MSARGGGAAGEQEADDDEVVIISDSGSEEEQAVAGTQADDAADDAALAALAAAAAPSQKRRRTTNTATTAEARLQKRQEAARLKEAEKAAKRDAKFAERLAAGRLQTREMVVLLERPLSAASSSPPPCPISSACVAALEALDRSTYGVRYAHYPPPTTAAKTTLASTTAALSLLAQTGAALAVRFARRPLTPETAAAVPEGTSLELSADELGPWAEPYRPPSTPTAAENGAAPPPPPRPPHGHVPYLLLVFDRPHPLLAQLRRDGGRGLVSLAAAAHPCCSLGVAAVASSGAGPFVSPDGRLAALFGGGGSNSTADPPLNWSDDERRWRELQLLCPALVQLRAVRSFQDVANQVVACAKALARQPYERLLVPSGELPWVVATGNDDEDDEDNEENNTTSAEAMLAGVEGGRTQGFRACRAIAALPAGGAQRSAAAALNCVKGVSGPRAAAVVERFPSLGALMAAYGVGGQDEGQQQGRAGGRGGGRGGRGGGGGGRGGNAPRSRYALTCGLRSIHAPEAAAVGDALARKLHHVLTCDDPDELVEG
jgi:hypothetical protein